MTKQEFFDRLIDAALDGTFPGIGPDGVCLYEATDAAGKVHRCAAGLLGVPPEQVGTVCFGGNGVFFSERMPEGMTLADLRSVQNIHDSVAAGGRRGDSRGTWFPRTFVYLIMGLPFFADLAPPRGLSLADIPIFVEYDYTRPAEVVAA